MTDTAQDTLLDALRRWMDQEGLDLLYVPSSDENLNEYVPEKSKRREAISGFSGSAGDLLLGRQQAWLFVDGRYHLQAEQEVDTECIEVMKLGLPDVLRLSQLLRKLVRETPGLVLGVDPCTVGYRAFEQSFQGFQARGGVVRCLEQNPVDALWHARLPGSCQPIRRLPIELTGMRVTDKLAQLRADLAEADCQATVVTALDQIAWLLNRRGSDIAYNPVFESFLVVLPERTIVFVDPSHADGLEGDGLSLEAISDFRARLPALARALLPVADWLVDPENTPYGVAQILEAVDGVQVRFKLHPIERRKSIKNDAEQAAVRRANLLASAAKTRALCWLERRIEAGERITETSFAEKLEACYASMEGFAGLSFNTISAAGAHGAIVHYGTPDPEAVLERGTMFLVDSGAHFGGGTTDKTRTVAVGDAPSAEQRRRFTLVLRGHAALASQRFPHGTVGSQLDALARSALWQGGENFGHGTGHGVGAFLCVHEGPFAIGSPGRGSKVGRALEAGQVTSIEPGVYITGWGGVRLENLYLVQETGKQIMGKAELAFDALVLIPFERRLIDVQLLEERERSWLNDYHARVCRELRGFLDADEQAWLEEVTSPL